MNLYNFYKNPKELNGYKDRIYFIPTEAYDVLMLSKNKELKDRDKLEKCISSDAALSFYYANHLLQRPFPKGEDAIAKNINFAYRYANEVLKGPFPKGEDTISEFPEQSFHYAYFVLKAPFPKGEDAIARSAQCAYSYAVNVLKGPFPKGERVIKHDTFANLWDEYQKFLKSL